MKGRENEQKSCQTWPQREGGRRPLSEHLWNKAGVLNVQTLKCRLLAYILWASTQSPVKVVWTSSDFRQTDYSHLNVCLNWRNFPGTFCISIKQGLNLGLMPKRSSLGVSTVERFKNFVVGTEHFWLGYVLFKRRQTERRSDKAAATSEEKLQQEKRNLFRLQQLTQVLSFRRFNHRCQNECRVIKTPQLTADWDGWSSEILSSKYFQEPLITKK